MTAAGFKIGGDDHAISPVMLGDAKLASDFADLMLQEGIYVIGQFFFCEMFYPAWWIKHRHNTKLFLLVYRY